ncbi:cytochrome c [Amaricoccus sp.]|uniref:c-type cytochrome n=1 Tax=Amaricoccus sp. TaxID=1872485 RepID=UPI00261E5B08|nr:cytochrome c [Amaricoccus sp.]HRO10798.1 cytochrome c [Amaricoccus sp.]
MRGLAILLGGLTLTTAAFAADDPIAVRQALMDNNGAAAALAGAVMKDELAYSPVIGKAVIEALSATAHAYGSFFPEGSNDPARTHASPKIWEDPAAFQAALDKYSADAAAARQASGKDGPADKAAFAAAVQPVLGNCKSCHEDFRLQD